MNKYTPVRVVDDSEYQLSVRGRKCKVVPSACKALFIFLTLTVVIFAVAMTVTYYAFPEKFDLVVQVITTELKETKEKLFPEAEGSTERAHEKLNITHLLGDVNETSASTMRPNDTVFKDTGDDESSEHVELLAQAAKGVIVKKMLGVAATGEMTNSSDVGEVGHGTNATDAADGQLSADGAGDGDGIKVEVVDKEFFQTFRPWAETKLVIQVLKYIICICDSCSSDYICSLDF